MESFYKSRMTAHKSFFVSSDFWIEIEEKLMVLEDFKAEIEIFGVEVSEVEIKSEPSSRRSSVQ